MPQMPARAAAAAFLLMSVVAGAAGAQPVPQAAPAGRPAVQVDLDARDTRQRLEELLKRQPPAVARVLKLDPSLIGNQAYLQPYPALRAFLAEHPEIAQNASFYFASVPGQNEAPYTPEVRRLQLMDNMIEGLSLLVVFGAAAAAFAWLIRTALDHRRWNRLSRIQAEVHTKLMDRLSATEDLMTYMQTSSGRRFLEAGPSPVPDGPRSVGAPVSRILWSVQAGIVLSVAGFGVLVARRSFGYQEELTDFLLLVGMLILGLGIGFMISAGASYVLSRRMGLLEPPASPHA